MLLLTALQYVFFFNDTATTEIYTLSLHDALPISGGEARQSATALSSASRETRRIAAPVGSSPTKLRSEEHTSELQSHLNLVCRLLLEKKKKNNIKSNLHRTYISVLDSITRIARLT